jgi:hypothetical protein
VLLRLLSLVAMGVGTGIVAVVYRRRSEADASLRATTSTGARWPAIPRQLLVDGVPCTWVIFTTPVCASCAHVRADLERAFPHHAVRTVDATERIELADRYEVRRAPTTLLADHEGRVIDRLVGPEAVRDFIGASEDTADLSD